MTDIVTLPEHGAVLTADGKATTQFQIYLDDITLRLNEDRSALKNYLVADVPAAASGYGLIMVTNETGGAVPAFSDLTNWRRVTDRVVIS